MFRDKNHKTILMRPLERLSGLPSPYGFFEGLGILYREKYGPNRRRGVKVPYLPKKTVINDGVREELMVGFVGDILDTKGLPAVISEDAIRFFDGCDAVVGNFESIITDQPGHGTSVRHIPEIIDTLERFFPPNSTYLSIANNHAGDYPAEVLFDSIHKLEDRGFHVFGWNERPFIDIGGSLRVIGATDWSNAACDSVFMLDDRVIPALQKADAYNILFPHWGYELELLPRRSMLRKAAAWSRKGFIAIIAHHGHTPRAIYPIDVPEGQPRTLAADSLGDFICGFEPEWYHFGMVARMGLGKDELGRRAVGSLCWEFCETRPDNGVVTTRLHPDLCL
jgi:hypothetical protein